MSELTLGKALLGSFLICVFVFMLTLKIGGSSNLPELVEKDGYCKITYGKTWDYIEDKYICFRYESGARQEEKFIEEDFRNICPKNKFLSLRFFSNCFYFGDSRS